MGRGKSYVEESLLGQFLPGLPSKRPPVAGSCGGGRKPPFATREPHNDKTKSGRRQPCHKRGEAAFLASKCTCYALEAAHARTHLYRRRLYAALAAHGVCPRHHARGDS